MLNVYVQIYCRGVSLKGRIFNLRADDESRACRARLKINFWRWKYSGIIPWRHHPLLDADSLLPRSGLPTAPDRPLFTTQNWETRFHAAARPKTDAVKTKSGKKLIDKKSNAPPAKTKPYHRCAHLPYRTHGTYETRTPSEKYISWPLRCERRQIRT